jgi:hypothetical protein
MNGPAWDTRQPVPFSVAESDEASRAHLKLRRGYWTAVGEAWKEGAGVAIELRHMHVAVHRGPAAGVQRCAGLSTSGSGYERLHCFFIWYSPMPGGAAPADTARGVLLGASSVRAGLIPCCSMRASYMYGRPASVLCGHASPRDAPCRLQHGPKCRKRPRVS